MDLKNPFSEKIETVGKKKIDKSKVDTFVLKVFVNGKWERPDPSEFEGVVSNQPIRMNEIEDIDEIDGAKCSMFDKNGVFLGDLWKKKPTRSSKKDSDPLSDINSVAETFNKFSETMNNMRGSVMGLFPEIAEMKEFYQHALSAEPETPKTLIDQIKEAKDEYSILKGMFGGDVNTSNYPMWAMMAKDSDLRAGIKEMAVDFVRDAGKAMGEGYQEGMSTKEYQEQQQQAQSSPPVSTAPVFSVDIPPEKEEIVKQEVDEPIEEKIEQPLIVEEEKIETINLTNATGEVGITNDSDEPLKVKVEKIEEPEKVEENPLKCKYCGRDDFKTTQGRQSHERAEKKRIDKEKTDGGD